MEWLRCQVSIKNRLKRLQRKIPDVYQETLNYLRLSWRITNRATTRLDPSPEKMKQLEAQARELVDMGETLSIKRLLKEIDGRGLPRPGIGMGIREET
jgi:hypothetical protein